MLPGAPILQTMSLTEILDELPRLTHEERRLLCRRALAVDEVDEVAVRSRSNSPVITKPEMTKNTSTPTKPPPKTRTLAW